MVTRLKIHCKIHDSLDRVDEVGIGTKKHPVSQIYDLIKSKKYEFYTEDQFGNKADVVAILSVNDRKSLTTSPDRITENNLDELDECT